LNDQSGGFNGDVRSVPAFADNGKYFADRHPRMAIDITGEGSGTADLVAFANQGAFAVRSQQSDFEQGGYSLSSEFGYFDGWRLAEYPRYVLDINNDGFRDLIGFSPTAVKYALNTGSSGVFEAPKNWPNVESIFIDLWEGALDARLVGDVNGDGIADLVGIDADSVTTEYGALIEAR